MGDRTWVHIYVAIADANAAREVIGNGEDEGEHDENTFGFQICESNWGGQSERDELQSQGIPYTGQHGDGCNYGETSFAFDGESEDEEATVEGDTYVLVDSDGVIETKRLDTIKAFHAHVKKAEAAMAARNKKE